MPTSSNGLLGLMIMMIFLDHHNHAFRLYFRAALQPLGFSQVTRISPCEAVCTTCSSLIHSNQSVIYPILAVGKVFYLAAFNLNSALMSNLGNSLLESKVARTTPSLLSAPQMCPVTSALNCLHMIWKLVFFIPVFTKAFMLSV